MAHSCLRREEEDAKGWPEARSQLFRQLAEIMADLTGRVLPARTMISAVPRLRVFVHSFLQAKSKRRPMKATHIATAVANFETYAPFFNCL